LPDFFINKKGVFYKENENLNKNSQFSSKKKLLLNIYIGEEN